jgi:transcriptional regulator with XRE-family HTH domain
MSADHATAAPDRDQSPSTPETLGAELRRRRRSLGLSQKQMASRLGLSAHSSITYYEAGRRIPPPDIIDAYERALQVTDRALHEARLKVLACRADELEAAREKACEAQQPQATQPAQLDRSPEPSDAEELANSREPAWPARRSQQTGSYRRRFALVALFVLIMNMGASSAWSHDTLPNRDATWTQSTQNETSKSEPATAPEPMDGDDPRARDCYADATVVQVVPMTLANGKTFGTLRLRHSQHCGASWGSAYYDNPQLFTIRITVHRNTDDAIVRDDWSNNTPPGSYSDMLSTDAGCVWVEAVVITPSGTSPSAKTGCFVATT